MCIPTERAVRSHRVSNSDVNVCAPQEGIALAMRALLAPTDHVIATTPCYQSLTEIARSIGCEVTNWDPALGASPHFDPEVLASLLRPGSTKLVVCNFPHNPTGALPTPVEFAAIVEQCRRAGCYLFVDEVRAPVSCGVECAGAVPER